MNMTVISKFVGSKLVILQFGHCRVCRKRFKFIQNQKYCSKKCRDKEYKLFRKVL